MEPVIGLAEGETRWRGMTTQRGTPHDHAPKTRQWRRHQLRAPPHRSLAARHFSDARNGWHKEPQRADGRNPAVVDPAEGAARSRRRLERNRSARAYGRACRAKPGLHLADRP